MLYKLYALSTQKLCIKVLYVAKYLQRLHSISPKLSMWLHDHVHTELCVGTSNIIASYTKE